MCAAIPVIKVLRESLVVTNVHRVLGIVNGTTNFMLTEMERGQDLRRGARRRAATAASPRPTRPTTSPARTPAAKMAILATVAFNSRFELADVEMVGIDSIDPLDVAAARELEMVIRLVGSARLVDGHVDVRVGPALVDRHHPLAAVEGAFNAVMLQGDAIREITLEGPGAGGLETASAVIADMASVIGTMGTGFLQNDAVWRELPRLPLGDNRSPWYFHLSVDDRPGRARARRRASSPSARSRSRACSSTRTATAPRCTSSRTRRARARSRTRWRRSPRSTRCAARRCRFPSSPIVASRSSDGRNRPLRATGCRSARHAAHHARARARRRSSAPRGSSEQLGVELYFKFEGANPTGSFKDRGHVRRRREGGRGRLRGHRLRVDREHRRVGGRVRGARRARPRSCCTRGRDRRREAGAVARGRRPRARDPRQLRRRAARAASSWPSAARSCSSTRSTRTGSRARRRRRSRSSRSSAARPTCSRCRTAAAATRARTPRASRRRARNAARLRARRPSARSRSPPRSGSPSRRTIDEVDELIANGRVEIVTVADAEITDAWLEIASLEGIFCEPSSAAGFAGLAHVELEPGSTVVCVLTGHGLKDTAAVEVLTERRPWSTPNVEAILAEVGA